MVQLLVNANRPDDARGTPLLSAAQAGTLSRQFTLCSLLPLLTTSPKDSPCGPCRLGMMGAVKLQLEWREGSSDRTSYDGQTQPSWAAEGRHDRVVELLLGQEDLSPDRLDNGGRTRLLWVAKSGFGGVVELLLGGYDVSTDKRYNGGRTLLL